MSEIRMAALVIIRDGKVVELQTVRDWTGCTVFVSDWDDPITVSEAVGAIREELVDLSKLTLRR